VNFNMKKPARELLGTTVVVGYRKPLIDPNYQQEKNTKAANRKEKQHKKSKL